MVGSGGLPGELPPLLRSVRHHVLLVVVTTLLLVGGAGLYYAVVHDDTYTSEATILLNPVPGNPLTAESAAGSGAQLTVAMETEAGLVGTPQVAALVASAVGESLPRGADELDASVPTGTQMIRVTYTSNSPERAQEGAMAFAQAYLLHRQTNAETTQQTKLDGLEQQLEDWQEQLRVATAAAADGDALAAQQVQIASARVGELTASIGQAQTVVTEPGEVTSPAAIPDGADGLPAPLVIGSAALAGLLLGCVLALLVEWRRDLVRDDEESEIGGLPVFATLPVNTPNALVVATEQDSPGHEAYRRLRAGVVANCPPPHALAVSAVGLRLDASTVAANLARTLQQAGFTVLVLAADLENGSVGDILGVSNGPGLAEVLAEGRALEDSIIEVDGLAVLRAGGSQYSREHYAGPELRRLMSSLKDRYDYLIVNAASTGTADGDAAISIADSVLLAVISSMTTHTQVAAALDRFSRLDINAVGVVNAPAGIISRGSVQTQIRHAAGGKRSAPPTAKVADSGRHASPSTVVAESMESVVEPTSASASQNVTESRRADDRESEGVGASSKPLTGDQRLQRLWDPIPDRSSDRGLDRGTGKTETPETANSDPERDEAAPDDGHSRSAPSQTTAPE